MAELIVGAAILLVGVIMGVSLALFFVYLGRGEDG